MKLAMSRIRILSALALIMAGSALGQRGGFGGRGVQQEVKLVQQYDKDGDGWLNAAERQAALKDTRYRAPTGSSPTVTYNPKLTPSDVKTYSDEPLYDSAVLRTLFLEFEDADWERQLAWFKNTDIELPARVIVDGKTYSNVGVRFRGNTSYNMVSEGYKRSLSLSFDLVNKKQELYGYRSLHLLNAAADQTFLRSVLYMQIARDYIPAPLANFMRVVINGESWGIYASVESFNSDLTKRAFGSAAGARWKVPGSPGGQGGLAFFEDNPESYKWVYEIKTKDDLKSWTDLMNLCKALSQTPAEQLERTLEPLLDVDEALRFLAVDKALINNDGYWTRGSDYSIYEDAKGRFHVLPYDSNETLRPTEGFGRGGWGGSGGVALDPFAGASDSGKALYRLLAVPALRERYLSYLRDIAEKWLSWDKIGPLAEKYQALIAADVKSDARKLYSTESFSQGVTVDAGDWGGGPISAPGMSLKSFIEQRRAYLLNHPDIKKLSQP